MIQLAEEAGVPPGVVNVVTGKTAEIGTEMTSSPLVRKLTFTGSTEVGKQLIEECASTVKRTSMELGGNAPFIVFDDADLDAALDGAMICKYRNAGQTCVCANRFLVQDGVFDEFARRLVERVKGLTLGNGADDGTDIGPLITEEGGRGRRRPSSTRRRRAGRRCSSAAGRASSGRASSSRPCSST